MTNVYFNIYYCALSLSLCMQVIPVNYLQSLIFLFQSSTLYIQKETRSLIVGACLWISFGTEIAKWYMPNVSLCTLLHVCVGSGAFYAPSFFFHHAFHLNFTSPMAISFNLYAIAIILPVWSRCTTCGAINDFFLFLFISYALNVRRFFLLVEFVCSKFVCI